MSVCDEYTHIQYTLLGEFSAVALFIPSRAHTGIVQNRSDARDVHVPNICCTGCRWNSLRLIWEDKSVCNKMRSKFVLLPCIPKRYSRAYNTGPDDVVCICLVLCWRYRGSFTFKSCISAIWCQGIVEIVGSFSYGTLMLNSLALPNVLIYVLLSYWIFSLKPLFVDDCIKRMQNKHLRVLNFSF